MLYDFSFVSANLKNDVGLQIVFAKFFGSRVRSLINSSSGYLS